MSTSGNVEIEVRNQIRQKNATICSKASVLANNLCFELEDGALLMKFNTAVNLVDYDLWIWNSKQCARLGDLMGGTWRTSMPQDALSR